MRRSAVLFSAVMGLLLVGCGGSSGTIEATGDSSETTADQGGSDAGGGSSDDVDALAESLTRSDLGVDEESAQCAAALMAGDLSPGGIEIVTSPSGSPSDLTPSDLDVVASAFNECIDASVFGVSAVQAFADSSGITLTEEESTCSVTAINDEFGGAGNLMVASMDPDSPDTVTAFLNGIGGCLTTESLVSYLTGQFASEEAIDEATATCISEALVGQYGGTELLQNFAASADGSLPADFEASITQAATQCATAGVNGAVGGGIGQ
jgi:hypothetical protein